MAIIPPFLAAERFQRNRHVATTVVNRREKEPISTGVLHATGQSEHVCNTLVRHRHVV